MRLLSSFELAFNAIKQNKMRSILTCLGIIIGVAAVIVMLSVGSGATNAIKKNFSSLGDNLLMIFPGSTNQGGVRAGAGTGIRLTSQDADAIKKECPSVASVSPIVASSVQAIYETQNWATRIQGVSVDFFDIRKWGLKSGNIFTEQDVKAATKVCLVGKTVVDNLYGGIEPVGTILRVNHVPFRVIGVLEEKGSSFGGDQDDAIICPYTTVQKRFRGVNFVDMIQATAKSTGIIHDAQNEITDLLLQRHHIGAGQDADFRIQNMADIIKTTTAVIGTIGALLGGVASISLIVGGIGIMNIMLVSVTERTREIGIRMAVGARKRDIMFQFLIEAIVLSLTGGIIGICSGVGISLLVTVVAKWATSISVSSIFLSFFFSAGVGIFFGYYPATRAANMNPIEALRYE